MTTDAVVGRELHQRVLELAAGENKSIGKRPDDVSEEQYSRLLATAEDDFRADDTEGARRLIRAVFQELGYDEEGPGQEVIARATAILAEQGIAIEDSSSEEFKDAFKIALAEQPRSERVALAARFDIEGGGAGPDKDVVLTAAIKSGAIPKEARAAYGASFDTNPWLVTGLLHKMGAKLPAEVTAVMPQHVFASQEQRKAAAQFADRTAVGGRRLLPDEDGLNLHLAAERILAERGLDEDYTDRDYFKALEEVQARAARAAREAEERDAAA